ncbi:MAG: hypothetical protein WCA93_01920, partial [Acidimicrobiia bacterium]
DHSDAAVSLEGGFRGAAPGPLGNSLETGDTLFKLVEEYDGEVGCGATVTLDGSGSTYQVTRGNDTSDGCKGPQSGLPFNFNSGTEGGRLFVDFATSPIDGTAVAQFLEVITWRFANPPNVGEPQHRTLSYDDNVGAGERVMPWCKKDPRVVGGLPSPIDTTQVLPVGHTSCLVDSDSRVTGLIDMAGIDGYPIGTWIKVDVVYNIGDGKRYT